MRVPRIYTPQPLAMQQSLLLEREASKHLLTVLRLKSGTPLKLFDGSGCEFSAQLEAIENGQARIRIHSKRMADSESPLHITLAQGISRGERMDFTLQKAVELGVMEIIPVLTERSVVRLDEKQAARKREHWQQLVIAACEQSGRVRVPKVWSPITLPALLATEPQPDLRLLLDPAAGSTLDTHDTPPAVITLLVGPEGGLSEAEIEQAGQHGFRGMRLGPRILRTETAALVALSILQARWGDLAGH